ncbi:hypothetical protein SCHPADRAFT_619029 [Schizopora paradoxa]|uniref:Uncharacterized protein n=1 Tax=Schizopora paradoxa TaxID=27342 RepID=A0A0H2R8F7_9AGAM|nr:hypothetical protein SCHPADRAFT_619029 [Schizopora paradoxa]
MASLDPRIHYRMHRVHPLLRMLQRRLQITGRIWLREKTSSENVLNSPFFSPTDSFLSSIIVTHFCTFTLMHAIPIHTAS